MFRCISTLFWLEFRAGFWGVDLTFKNRGPIKVSGRWWFKMFFFWIWQAETWGSELAWNYLEPALSGFWRGRKKGSFQQRAWRGSELRNCSGVRIWAWSSSTSFVLKPHFYVSRGKNALFFCLVSVVFLNNSGCRCLREMPPSQEYFLESGILVSFKVATAKFFQSTLLQKLVLCQLSSFLFLTDCTRWLVSDLEKIIGASVNPTASILYKGKFTYIYSKNNPFMQENTPYIYIYIWYGYQLPKTSISRSTSSLMVCPSAGARFARRPCSPNILQGKRCPLSRSAKSFLLSWKVLMSF